jgi:hypothetical protein
MTLEQFRKATAHLPGNTPIVVPGSDHSYIRGVARVTKGVFTDKYRAEISPYFGDEPELYGLASNVIVATRTLEVIEVE